jgi:hypothetical protein
MKRKRLIENTQQVQVRQALGAGITPACDAISLRLSDGYTESVRIVWRPANLGGQRAYFICPGCDARALILYAVCHCLACRKCHGLAYRTENMTPLWRKSAKLRKLEKRAGIDTSRLPRLPAPKPQWMRWHSFLKLRQAIKAADHDFAAAWMRSLSRSGLLR